MTTFTRRELIAAGAGLAASAPALAVGADPLFVVDIHQHTHYAGRSDDTLLEHQRALGAAKTVLLPAGSKLGLDADCFGNDSVLQLAKQRPDLFAFFANEVPDIRETRAVLEKYLSAGAAGIGEQKFPVDCDSTAIRLIADIARQYHVPVLLHFQHNRYNTGFTRFHKVLERYPSVNFIGHAQTWWGHIDRKHDPRELYPKGLVTPGGYTDRLLSDYPNMYGDLSAGSGLKALLRDEDHARAFLSRHRSKLLYGSDCDDHVGRGVKCSGSQCLGALRRLAPAEALADILAHNARRIISIDRQVGR